MNALSTFDQKRALRMRYRNRRNDLGKVERAVMDRDINQHFLTSPELKRCRQIAAYWTMDGEPDMATLLQRLPARGVSVFLPVIAAGKRMSFRQWQTGTVMRPNHYGIPEPAAGKELPLAKMDMALIPLVAWDRSGRRLGMGGGYYDKAFKGLLGLDRPRRVGIAYGLQESEQLIEDEWDVRLHDVVTENGWFTCSP